MAKLKRVLRCFNCGEVLQSVDPELKGYVPQEVIVDGRVVYCQRCYEKMKSVNTGLLAQEADDDIALILKEAALTNSLIIWVVDLFSFNGYLSPDIVNIVKDLDIVVIGTKFDLFPRGVHHSQMEQYLKERFAEVGIVPVKVRVLGNLEEINNDNLSRAVKELCDDRDVFMIGSDASGKTSLINRCMKFFVNNSNRVIKTETYPNTNAQVLEIPLNKQSTLYEVPGFSLVNMAYGNVEKEVAKQLMPKGKIRVDVRYLAEGDAFIVGSLAAFSLEQGRHTKFKFYSSDKVETKKVASKNLKNELATNYIKRAVRPVSERISLFIDYDVFEYVMENDDQLHDIGIAGLGWVSFIAKGQTIRVYLPKGVAVKECLSKVR